MLDACARKKARHDECVRCGAGWRPASSSTLRTEVAETGMPRPLSSPTIRLYPQCGFSSARRRISSRSERPSGGRPRVRCEYVHRRAMSWRCQRSRVSGLIGKTAQAGRASERLSDASSARSARVSFGREVCRRRIASSCRRTRISISFERRGRPSSHNQREQVPDNEIHERPEQTALPRPRQERRTSEPDAPASRGRVCEPCALGNGLNEAETLAALARLPGTLLRDTATATPGSPLEA